MTAMAQLIVDLCQGLGLDRIDLVGNDTGGVVAQIVAASRTGSECTDHPVLPRSVLIRRVRAAGWRWLRAALRESRRASVTGRRLAEVLGIAGQLSPAPVSLVLAA